MNLEIKIKFHQITKYEYKNKIELIISIKNYNCFQAKSLEGIFFALFEENYFGQDFIITCEIREVIFHTVF